MSFVFPESVEGYTSEDECRELYRLACMTPEDGVIVELGSYKGRSAIALAQSGRDVFCVDRFEAEPDDSFQPLPDHHHGDFSADMLMSNAAAYGVEGNVFVIVGDTASIGSFWPVHHEGAPNIDMLFIDAGHDYESVKADWEAWRPHVKEDGIVVFDDSLWGGVQQLLMELYDWTPLPGAQVGGFTAMTRIKETADVANH